MLLDIAAIIAGFALLVWGADRFITGAAGIARGLGISPMMIGLTIVGFGTSAPEILVALMASLQGNAGLAIGNAVGSNVANIGLILGVTALIAPLTVHSRTLRREYPLLLAISLLAVALMLDDELSRVDGVILCVSLVAVMFWLVNIVKRGAASDPLGSEYAEELPEALPLGRASFWFVLGLLVLLGSSRLLVWGAVNIATAMGVSDLVIGLTIVAIGTSLPELAAGITSALKNEHDLAIGNVIGSNIFNLLAVLSVPALVAPGGFPLEVISRDLPVMMGLTLALFVMGYGNTGVGRINRFEALLLVCAFIGYQGWIFMDSTG